MFSQQFFFYLEVKPFCNSFAKFCITSQRTGVKKMANGNGFEALFVCKTEVMPNYNMNSGSELHHDTTCLNYMQPTKAQICLHSLISTFVVGYLDSITPINAISKISRL